MGWANRYMVIRGDERNYDLDIFFGRIEEKLSDGWELYGNPYVDPTTGHHFQALIKQEERQERQERKAEPKRSKELPKGYFVIINTLYLNPDYRLAILEDSNGFYGREFYSKANGWTRFTGEEEKA